MVDSVYSKVDYFMKKENDAQTKATQGGNARLPGSTPTYQATVYSRQKNHLDASVATLAVTADS